MHRLSESFSEKKLHDHADEDAYAAALKQLGMAEVRLPMQVLNGIIDRNYLKRYNFADR